MAIQHGKDKILLTTYVGSFF